MLKVCQGATIVGTVVNAANGQPIAGAFLQAVDFVSGAQSRYAFTDVSGAYVLSNVTVGTNNAPNKVRVMASANGFAEAERDITVFCNASIAIDFGQPTPTTGSVSGTVRNADTGLPLAGAFMGSEFGGAATTVNLGHYTLSNVPLGVNGADRLWQITAAPDGFTPLTESVTV